MGYDLLLVNGTKRAGSYQDLVQGLLGAYPIGTLDLRSLSRIISKLEILERGVVETPQPELKVAGRDADGLCDPEHGGRRKAA
ncbi:hypothetical protein TNCT_169631 [Trichonephila clavata]|uniref:Uncharacterized protein n=1 Tax=Trichonephila clavata TaxID=2740835 RepID=A0A8X6HJY8_TRICU|nr:hypothetical protein TNCT_169631 [Trichonephila clavata]